MRLIGITGGIGCGKSFVLEILEKEFKGKVILSDLVAHELMEPGGKSFIEVLKYFGEEILNEQGSIDRRKLGEIVFHDEEKLAILNGITHPNVKAEIENRMERIKEKGEAAFLALESALLIEAGYEKVCDEIWYIYAREEVRIKRLMEARGYTKEKCLSVMKNQKDEAFYRAHCQVIIDNSNTAEETNRQIARAVKKWTE